MPQNINQVNLYTMQETFDKLMDTVKEQLNIDDGVATDLCLSYVRNLVVKHVINGATER